MDNIFHFCDEVLLNITPCSFNQTLTPQAPCISDSRARTRPRRRRSWWDPGKHTWGCCPRRPHTLCPSCSGGSGRDLHRQHTGAKRKDLWAKSHLFLNVARVHFKEELKLHIICHEKQQKSRNMKQLKFHWRRCTHTFEHEMKRRRSVKDYTMFHVNEHNSRYNHLYLLTPLVTDKNRYCSCFQIYCLSLIPTFFNIPLRYWNF